MMSQMVGLEIFKILNVSRYMVQKEVSDVIADISDNRTTENGKGVGRRKDGFVKVVEEYTDRSRERKRHHETISEK